MNQNLKTRPVSDDLREVEPSAETMHPASIAGASSIGTLPKDDFDRDVWCVLGLPIDVVNIETAAAKVVAASRDGKRLSFVTPNVNILVASHSDPSLRTKIIDSDLSLVDGAPLVKIAAASGVPIKARCAGSDVFDALKNRPGFAGRQIKVFFFGGRDGAAKAASAKLNKEKNGLVSVGYHNPGFGDIESMSSESVIEKINEAAPDFIVVALGFAKGQAWIDFNKDRLSAPVISHLGAVVDFAAGSIKRSPKWLSKIGGEWLWRIFQEPSLWQRYFKDGIALSKLAWSLGFKPNKSLKIAASEQNSAAIRIENVSNSVVARISGEHNSGNVAEIRTTFRNLVTDVENIQSKEAIVLDLSDATSLDASFWGMVLMLEKHASRMGIELVVAGTGDWVQKNLKKNRLPYRIVEVPSLPAEVAAGNGFAQAS